jgi:hypothetical protein
VGLRIGQASKPSTRSKGYFLRYLPPSWPIVRIVGIFETAAPSAFAGDSLTADDPQFNIVDLLSNPGLRLTIQ